MRYAPELYAKALAAVAHGNLAPAKEREIVKNFLTLVRANGDGGKLPKIVEAAEKLLRAKTGRRRVVIESARPLGILLKKFSAGADAVEEKIDPALIAGVRITVNDELQYDGSLRHKLDTLFS